VGTQSRRICGNKDQENMGSCRGGDLSFILTADIAFIDFIYAVGKTVNQIDINIIKEK
jgi:hypothetical protein